MYSITGSAGLLVAGLTAWLKARSGAGAASMEAGGSEPGFRPLYSALEDLGAVGLNSAAIDSDQD